MAQWNAGEPGGDKKYGHVAYVEQVFKNEDGSVRSITISQFNADPYKYSDDELKPSDSGYPPRFIHFEQLRVNGNIGWFPPVEFCQSASQWFVILKGSDNEAYKAGSSSISACPMNCSPN